MTNKPTIRLVLCWHMHQPDYRDHIHDEFLQPWVYLHGIKDYVDMAAHLENNPGAKAVVNFSPILLEQLLMYEQQIAGFLNNSAAIRDPLLAGLASSVLPSDHGSRMTLISACLRSNRKHQIERFSDYARLTRMAGLLMEEGHDSAYLSNQFLADLVTWYHLAWLGETIRRTDKTVQALIAQGRGFTLHQRRDLLRIIGECISSIRHRYRKLADDGRIELATSPYTHPMLPLLLDFTAARQAQPEIRLPILAQYPGGEERARWHLHYGISVFEQYFGFRPTGCWPSEGGVSNPALQLIADAGFGWSATGENVIRHSFDSVQTDSNSKSVHTPLRDTGSGITLFARDDTLSDLIGFTYADWHSDDAVADLIHRIEVIAKNHTGDDELVVSIIMDGENAWEYYPENGYYFLSTLYGRLVEHPYIQLTTYRDIIADSKGQPLQNIIAGSWVFGNFSTWIGNEDKNRAWDILGDVKRVYDAACSSGKFDSAQQKKIDAQLAACEGSDWFWWFGDYNPAQTVSDFERLFRIHLVNLYQMLSTEPPQYLTETLSHGSGSPQLGGVIRPGTAGDSA
jgi:alpha-amylase/alpha-mannosidase (GH57 family)